MPRFFVDKENVQGNKIVMDNKTDVKHITTVLRNDIGDTVEVSCDGVDYDCVIEDIQAKAIVFGIVSQNENNTEPKIKVALFQALPKQDKLELVVQKSVELGVNEIIPIETTFTVSKINSKTSSKIERLQKISETASKQCGRGIIPKVHQPLTFKESIKYANDFELKIVAYEKEKDVTLKEVLKNNVGVKSICFFVGSEGGFSTSEIDMLKENGFNSITLGNRILRTETVGLTVLSNIMYEFE